METEKVRTIGIDIDEHNGFRLVKTYLNACKLGNVRTYYTKNGFHLLITLDRPIERWKTLDIRATLEDDGERIFKDEIDLDARRYYRFDRLFTTRYKKGEKYTRKEFEIK